MVDIIKQDMTDIWAVAGDVVAPESAKVRAGWGVEAVPRQWWNWFENRQDSNIAYMLQKGIPEWDQFTEYLTNKSYVQRNNIVYKCILTGVNKDPVSNPANWKRAFADYSPFLDKFKDHAIIPLTAPYINNNGTGDLYTVGGIGLTLAGTTSAADARAVISAQASNSNLNAISAVAASTNALPYFTGTTTMGTTILTQAGRDILAGVDMAAIRATLGLTGAATTAAQSFFLDNTVGRLLKVGAFGLGASVDLRGHIFATGTPSSVFGAGTVFGFVNGGNGDANAMNIPGLTGISYGTLQINGQYSDASGLSAMSRVFITTGGRTFTQTAASANAWGPWTENWTTASLVKTTGPTDTTVGSMVRTGDFGLGNSVILAESASLDAVIVSGNYRLQGGHAGLPSPAYYGQMQVIRGLDTIVQIAYSYSTPRTYTRSGNPATIGGTGGWTAWVEQYNTGNTAQVVADVTAGIQPTLNAKVNKAGDTMSGGLTLPIIELGSTAQTGLLDFHISGQNTDYDVRIYPDLPIATGTAGQGRIVLAANGGCYISGQIQGQNGMTMQGTIAASGQISGGSIYSNGSLYVVGATTVQGLNAANISASGAVTAAGVISAVGGTISLASNTIAVRCTDPANGSNVHLWFYNNNGNERALIYASSDGALHLRANSQPDTLTLNADRSATFGAALAVTARVTCADIVSTNNVYSGNGNAWLATDGNLYGSTWGGYLSTWIYANQMPRNEFFVAGMANMTSDQIGSVGFLQNLAGVTLGFNAYCSGASLRYASHNSSSGTAATGSWRCLGWCNAGGVSLFVRYA